MIFFKQYKLSNKIGASRIILANIMFYVSIINFVLISLTAYHTTLKYIITPILPFFNFPIFIGIIVCIILIAIIIEYKFVLPSLYAFQNEQGFKHDNPIKDMLVEINKQLDNINSKL